MKLLEKKISKSRFFLFFLISLVSFIFPGCYLIEQGKGQYDLRFSQIPIEEAIEQEKDPKIKEVLSHVPEIKAFAEQKLLLKKSENYTGYYYTPNEGITFVVTAAPKTSLTPYSWWFPIIGSVPYKGFFKRSDAEKLKNQLEKEGYDTYIFSAIAYSSLGWFKDPVTTPMVKQGLGYIADTLIHEQTHATLYVKGQGNFNEQLASFVGTKGAEQYLKSKNLLNKTKTKNKKSKLELRKKFNLLIEEALARLEKIYASEKTVKIKLSERELVFNQLTQNIVGLLPKSKIADWKMNNARILQFRRYKNNSNEMRKYWEESHHNWKKFWELIRKRAEKF